MTGWALAAIAAVGIAASASGATLGVASDKLVYAVGETITLTVTGDAAGATAYGIFGKLDYRGALVDNGASPRCNSSARTASGPRAL